jgi:creatinine amidohydrolase
MKWENLSTEEFSGINRATPVILNIAAIEQHGPHLPLRTDAAIGSHFLARLDNRLDDKVLILPQVKVCCSEHHMDFAGTLSVRHDTFLHYVSDILRSVIQHGFCNLIIFNSHGGNQAIGQVLIEKLGTSHPNCRFAMLTWWRLAKPELEVIRESSPGGVGHACEFETSLMLYAFPESVRELLIGGMSRASTYDWAEGDMLIGERGSLFRTMAEKSNGTGVVGDPSLATAEKGERITEAVVTALASVVESLRTDHET